MPTYLVGPTRPYTTIQSAVDATPSNLSGTGIHEIIVDSGTYTEQVVIVKNTTISDYVHIKAASGSEHQGNINSGVIITSGEAITVVQSGSGYGRLSNLVIKCTRASGFNSTGTCLNFGANSTFDNLLLVREGDGYGYGASTNVGNSSVPYSTVFYKCLAIMLGTAITSRSVGFYGGVGDFPTSVPHNITCINCGSYGFITAFQASTFAGCSSTFINCWGYHGGQSGASDFSGTINTSASSNNASRGSTAPGANSLLSRTLAQLGFVNSASSNFHITSNSVLYGAGSNQSSLFTTDWDLETIGIWCIGPDGFVIEGIAPTTSSSPHRKTNAPQSKVADARILPGKKVAGEKSKGLGSPGRTGDVSVTLPKSKKGQRSAFISIMPELNGYGAVNPGLGTGNMVPFYNETLTFNKEYREQDHVGNSRAKQGRVSLFTSPSGSVEMPLRSNDIIPLFQAHFQKRIGTTPASGTTFYEFTPSKGRVQLGGSAFGTGSYSGSGTSDAFSFSLFKDYAGTGYHFKSGVVESLTFKVHSILEPSVTAECAFREGTVTRRSTSHPYGSYSLLPEFSPENCTVDFMGLPVLELEFQCRNRIERNNVVSGTKSLHKFGRYEVTGKALVDFSKQGFGYVGSMLNGASFPVSGTFRNGERDKIVFHMADCRLFEIPMNLNEQISPVSFKAYESDDGSTAPIKLSVWTRNYSATSFQPN